MALDEKWGKKYPVVIESWQNNREELSQYFQYTGPIRRMIYTTNAVEVVFKVRENSKVVNKTVYVAVGLRRDGRKEVLGLWLGKSESAAFWMSVLNDMKARGTEDILITATDNLNGFTDTIRNVFPESRTQICEVHQIRNACRYLVWRDKKTLTADMKHIYNAPTQEGAKAALEDFARNCEGKYSYA